ncbi:putative RNA-directed DNA polymerase from transposon BS [Frankliniella fusca]|uniref:RNA-directed DNA polymerase from transposon BS n=1 Tax=Frankliniella fusca TaxID=407009 RepID=A0AAE1HJ41_9NEOP|nr:putative RNA-directed DNA polymerase from transposon BS [Frankliniella fusca]
MSENYSEIDGIETVQVAPGNRICRKCRDEINALLREANEPPIISPAVLPGNMGVHSQRSDPGSGFESSPSIPVLIPVCDEEVQPVLNAEDKTIIPELVGSEDSSEASTDYLASKASASTSLGDIFRTPKFQKEYSKLKVPDTFVNYFTSAVDKLLEKDIAHQCSEEETSKYIEKIPKINSTFRLHPTTAQEVSKYIDQLKNKSNATLDNITDKLLKKIKTNISPHISRIINKSFQDGIVPSQMKISRVNGRKSSTSPIRHGVIQGSTLGPLLFIIFINDISTLKLHGNPTLFADDTNVFYFGNSTAEIKNQMEEDFITIKKWLRLNLLFMNVEKTNYIIFSKPGASQEENDHLTLDNQEVKKSETVKFLGLTLDHHLHWNDHIDSVTRKLAPIIGALHRIRNILSEKAKKSIYYSLIQSQLSYMNLIWGSATETRLHPLKTMQNRAIKTLFEKEYRTPTTQLYKPLGFLPLAKLHEKTLMTTGFAIYNEFWRCQTIFARNISVHSHNTRSCNLLHTQSFKSSKYGIRSIYNSIVQAFNSIPQEYSNCNNMKSFKTAINKFILSTLNKVPRFLNHEHPVNIPIDYEDVCCEMFIQIREYLQSENTTAQKKIQLLSVLPNSWSANHTSMEFEIGKKISLKTKQKIVKDQGLIPTILPKFGTRTLPEENVELVKNWYRSQDISRELPGMKDVKRVKENGKSVLKRKRLFLTTLKEGYQSLKSSYPELKIGFSTFAALRPKEVVLAGQAGTHTVRVFVHTIKTLN